MRNIFISFVITFLFVSFCSCKKKEELTLSPLKKGDRFVYEHIKYIRTFKGQEIFNIPIQHINTIKPINKSKGFKLEFIIRATDSNGKKFDNNISQKQSYSLFDKYGRITGRTKGNISSRLKGNYIKLWLPPNKRKAGGIVKFSMDIAKWEISGPIKWQKWNVWKAVCDVKYTKTALYFDKETGFLVGNDNQRLIETNIKNLDVAKSLIPEAIKKWKKLQTKNKNR